MRKHILKIGMAMLIMLMPAAKTPTRIVSWNALDFYGATGGDRVEDFRAVLDELKPDILVVQDMGDAEGVDLFLNQVLNHSKKLYKKAKFSNQADTASAFFYNGKNIKLNSTQEIPTGNRSVWVFKVKIKKGAGKGKNLTIYSVHLPEGTNAAAKNSRTTDAEIIRTQLNTRHSSGDLFLLCGTFNLFGTTDAAFKALTESGADESGRVFDPLDKAGKWHRKKKVAIYHTESTRKASGGVGASGGLDDRYDNFFISQGITDSTSLTYVEDSYLAYGNDGKHFKKAVTTPANKIVPQDIAEALYRASDHLPIVMDLGLPAVSAPAAPSQLSAQAVSSSQIQLTWQDNSDNEDGFHLSRARNCSACHTDSHCKTCHMGVVPPIPSSPNHEFSGHNHSWRQFMSVNSNVESHTDSGLPAGATFSYRVTAYNAGGTSANSNTASATTNSSSVSLSGSIKKKDK